jgi:hypothetical protein
MTSQYGAYELHAGYARLRASTRMHTPTRPGKRVHAYTQICNIYCFSTATIIRKRASVLRYMYVVCLIYLIRWAGHERHMKKKK